MILKSMRKGVRRYCQERKKREREKRKKRVEMKKKQKYFSFPFFRRRLLPVKGKSKTFPLSSISFYYAFLI